MVIHSNDIAIHEEGSPGVLTAAYPATNIPVAYIVDYTVLRQGSTDVESHVFSSAAITAKLYYS